MCKIENCTNEGIRAKGLCAIHYQKEWRKANPNHKNGRKCSFEGCNNSHSARGYCRGHLNRLQRHGDVNIVKNHMNGCTVEGCNHRSSSKHGYCHKHLQRYLRTGNPLTTKTSLKTKRHCQVLGCDRKLYSSKYCDTHFRMILEVYPENYQEIRFEDVFGEAPYQCYLCGKFHETWDTKKVWADHVIPVAKGGLFTVENIKPTCKYCNMAKRDMDLDEFIQMCKDIALYHS